MNSFTNDEIIYNYPLHEASTYTDLRDMCQQSEAKYADEFAYLIKDPVALREVSARSVSTKDRITNAKEDYRGVTYKQFHSDRRALGSALKNLGINSEQKIIILAETRYEWFLTYLSNVSGLAVVVPVDAGLSETELLNILVRSEAETIFFSEGQGKKLSKIAADASFIKNYISFDLPSEEDEDKGVLFFWDLLEQGQTIRDAGDLSYDTLPIDSERLAVLLFTSGTTAKSKAVMLNHRNFTTQIEDTQRHVVYTKDDTMVSILPLHHTYEATVTMLAVHSTGASPAVNDGLRHLVTNFKQTGMSIMIVVPLVLESIQRTILRQINSDEATKKRYEFALKLSKSLLKIRIDVRKQLFKNLHDALGGKLRTIIVGGAAADPEVLDWFEDLGFICIQGYGITESSPIVSINREGYRKSASVGLPMYRSEVKVDSPDENGIGEFIIRSPYIMMGYYGDEELTKEAIDEEGFFHSGDYGYIDADNFIHITGRKANIIVTKNGKNIFPEEIEFVLEHNVPLIKEIVVFGVSDGDGDQIVNAEVFCDEEVIAKTPELLGLELTSAELLEYLNKQVSRVNRSLQPYQRVKNITLRDEPFERNTSQKILRFKYNQKNV